MSITTYLIVFAAGLMAGILIYAFAQKVSSGEELAFVDALKRFFARIKSAVPEIPAPQSVETGGGAGKEAAPEPVDPREQNIYESAQKIRSILLVLAANIKHTDKVASDSTLFLGDVKNAISGIGLPNDPTEAHSLLAREIDRVIASNSKLQGELERSQAVLNEQQRQIEALRTAVRIDSLTQLANRAYFDEKLNEMMALYSRYKEPFSLMMIDLDGFKAINDSFGHPAGDRILKGVALKIKASLRGSDFLARFGGDEYALIAIKTDLPTATEVAWKLCEEVRGSRFILDGKTLSVTLSIGVAEIVNGDSGETLLKRADEALYRTKAGGRNGVSVVTL